MSTVSTLIDPVADLVLGLRRVSRTQWVLRLSGVAGTILALVTALPTGLFTNLLTGTITIGVAVILLTQTLRPDTVVGAAAPLLILLTLAGQGDISLQRGAGVGVALLLGHASFALAAVVPAHGAFESSAWRLGLRGLLPVLALSVLGAVLVVALSGVHLGPWMLVVGVLAAIALFFAVLPRAPR